MAHDLPGSRHEVQVQGVLIRGLIDHIARSDGVAGVDEVLGQLDLSGTQIDPDGWYALDLLQELVGIQARTQDMPPKEVAYTAGRRMASSSLGEIEDAIGHLPVKDLIDRLDRLVRIRDEPAIRFEVEEGEVVLSQVPPGGRFVCPIFHGIVEGLIEHLDVAGRIELDDAHGVSCIREGDDRCVYRIDPFEDKAG